MDDNLIIEDGILRGYKENLIQTVTIPEGIAAISDNAFSDFPNLYRVEMPKSLVMIGNGVFKSCPKLKSIDLTNVCSVGTEAFSGCISLTEVVFGKDMSYLANDLFLGCTALSEITLPENISYIGCECFKDCTSLTKVTIKGAMEIDNNAFENCTSLCSITLPDTTTHISPNAFSFCCNLSAIIFENRFVDIDENAFENSVDLIINSAQNSAAQSFAKNSRFKFRPIIIANEYAVVTKRQLDILSKSDITFFAKQPDVTKDEYVIQFDKSAEEKIIEMIGGIKNDE